MKNTKKKEAYLIGIKGVGMTALALWLKQAGYDVSGSDSEEVFSTDAVLRSQAISVLPFDAKNLRSKKPELVIISAAYGKENPEVKEAIKRRLEPIYYSEALGKITSDKKVVAIAGVHGKTTTTSLVSYILETAKLSPSFLIGAADAGNLKTNSKKGQGEYFVLEADEYRKSPEDPSPKFLDLTPQIAVITSIELDHPDIYPSIEDIYNAFFRFACRVPRDGTIILCWDYPRAKKLLRSLADRNFETYGFESDAKWRIVNEQASDRFYLEKNRDKYGPFELQIPGKHNILNATAAVITSLKLGVSEDVIKKSLKQFKGVGRRFEKVFESEKIKIYDDYAHHPTAIQATLAAFRQKFPKYKIWCIFQPHTFSRTQRLLKEFGLSFSKADRVYIADIYSSEREKDGKINSLDLVEEIKKNRSGVRIIRDLPKASELIKEVKTPTVIVTMGAGDIFKLGQEMAKKIKAAK